MTSTATAPQGTALVPTANLFEGHEIRTVERKNQVWISTDDLAAAWGIDRTTPLKIIDRNPELFKGKYFDGDVMSQSGAYLNEQGLYVMVGKVTASRLKNPEAKEAVIRFQNWVPELIQKFRKGELTVPQQTPDPFVRELERAEAFSRITGVPLPLAQVQALRKAGDETGEDNHRYIEILRPTLSADRNGCLNPSQIGDKLAPRKRGYEINEYLYRNGYQVRSSEDPTKWVPTEKGEPYSYWHPYIAENGHAAYQLLWHPDILRASGLVRG